VKATKPKMMAEWLFYSNFIEQIVCLPPAFTLVSCSAYFSTLKMEALCSSETSVDNGLYVDISQKMVLFIITAVRTSNLFSEIYLYGKTRIINQNAPLKCKNYYKCKWSIHCVPGGNFNILGRHSIGHPKKKRTLYERMSYSKRFPIFGAQNFPSLPP
jgi:hypothetical protein